MPESQDVRRGGALQNRTGLATSPHRDAMAENASAFTPSGTVAELQRYRTARRRDMPPVGTMPPPASVTGLAREAVHRLKGERTTMLLDKLAERLAFERIATRLYDALLEKLEGAGGFENGPLHEDLLQLREDERRHFLMLAEAIEEQDGDPTAMTPSADLVGVASSGVLSVVTDERTRLAEALEALLVAELGDREGWTLLILLAEQLGQEDLANRCRDAQREEERHLEQVRSWVKANALASVS